MNAQRRQMRGDVRFAHRIGVAIVLFWAASCSSSDEAPFGGRIEHPVGQGSNAPPASAIPMSPSTGSPLVSASSSATPPRRRRTPSEVYEDNTGTRLSSVDKAILDECPDRLWSQNVPRRSCTKDDDCGDGFCDRGRCAAIWTCRASYGQPCETDDWCSGYLCIDHRCRSCISDKECKWEPNNRDPRCASNPSVPGSRDCQGITPSIVGSAEARPPQPSPKK